MRFWLNDAAGGRQSVAPNSMRSATLEDHSVSPINPLPPIVWALALPMIVLELMFALGDAHVLGNNASAWRITALENYAIFPEYWRQKAQLGVFDFDLLLRFVTYPFLNNSVVQALFGVVLLLALGKTVGEVFRWWATAVVFFGSAVMAGVVYASFVPQMPLFGAFPAVYGMIGAFSFLIWVRLAGTGVNQFRAFSLIGGLMVIQLIYGIFFGASYLWLADIVGFITGFFLSFVVSPGGFGRVRARLRQR